MRLLGRFDDTIDAERASRLLQLPLSWEAVIVPIRGGRRHGPGLSVEEARRLAPSPVRLIAEIQEPNADVLGAVASSLGWGAAFLSESCMQSLEIPPDVHVFLSVNAGHRKPERWPDWARMVVDAVVVDGRGRPPGDPDVLQALYRMRKLGWPVGYLCDLGSDEDNRTALAVSPEHLIVSVGASAEEGLQRRLSRIEEFERSLHAPLACPTPDEVERLHARHRTIVAARPLRKGERLTRQVIRVAEGGPGVSAALWSEGSLEDAVTLYDLREGEPLTFGLIEPPELPARQRLNKPVVSVVIRSKNEAQWIARCVGAIRRQQGVGPVEIVLVDNDSTDGTPAIAEQMGCAVIPIHDADFTYGRALNLGIEHCNGEAVALLSAHCVPVNDRWLLGLLANLHVPATAGVYGRQEPLPDSHDFDKRDLWTTFGLTRRTQRGEDYFFHNANCLVRRAVWSKLPFDEELRGVEDRAWAKRILRRGYQVVYEPAASVYHYHGIHQGRDEQRAQRVTQVIEMIRHAR